MRCAMQPASQWANATHAGDGGSTRAPSQANSRATRGPHNAATATGGATQQTKAGGRCDTRQCGNCGGRGGRQQGRESSVAHAQKAGEQRRQTDGPPRQSQRRESSCGSATGWHEEPRAWSVHPRSGSRGEKRTHTCGGAAANSADLRKHWSRSGPAGHIENSCLCIRARRDEQQIGPQRHRTASPRCNCPVSCAAVVSVPSHSTSPSAAPLRRN